MSVWKRVAGSSSAQRIIGFLSAEYLRLVRNTSSLVVDPADFYERIGPDVPFITAMWHGQHFMMPFLKRREHLVKVLISRHRDGEINAIAARRLNVEPIRGSGTSGRDFLKKGGVAGFKQMMDALELEQTIVLGNALGGWLAAEIAVRTTARIARLVMVDAVGVKVGGRDLITGTIELERDLPRNLGVAVFFDGGNAINHFNDQLAYSAGIGMRLRLPVVTVGFDIAQSIRAPGYPELPGPRLHLNIEPKL